MTIDRRTFLQAASLATLGLPTLAESAAAAETGKSSSGEVENSFFRVHFDGSTGKLDAWRKDGSQLLSNAVSRAVMPTEVRISTEPEYTREVEVRKTNDALGSGQQLVARCSDRRRQLDLEVQVTLYDNREMLVVETIARNPSHKDSLVVRTLEPTRAVFDEDGSCHWGGQYAESGNGKVLRNGYMCYDPGRVENFFFTDRYSIQGMWDMGFYLGPGLEGLVIGFIENYTADGRITVWYDDTEQVEFATLRNQFSLVTEALLTREFLLKPGDSIRSGRLAFVIAPDAFTALESYAQAMGDLQQVKFKPILNAWTTWNYSFRYHTEDEQLKNAEYIAKYLKPYGLDWVQIDAGYQRAFGDWEGNAQYPHGMKWLAGKIRDLGLKPGIWIAPWEISGNSDVAKNHRDWLVRNSKGDIYTYNENYTKEINGATYALDITHPGAQQWMYDLFKTMSEDWGYDYFKIDRIVWNFPAPRYYAPSTSKAEAYRLGFETIRKAIGPDRYILDCGPAPNTVGLLDSTRINLDSGSSWHAYVNNTAPAMSRRYYFHKRAWINDTDLMSLMPVTIPQAQGAASLIGLSGGTTTSCDRLYQMDPARLEILKKVLPAYGEASRPVDLFERDTAEIFALPIKKSFGEWMLVGMFNYDDNADVEKQVSLKQLRLDPSKSYLAYDFWSESLHNVNQGELRVRLERASVALFAVHEDRGVPQVISTSRHITQGGIELEHVEWDAATSTLRGISLGPQGSSHNVVIYVPKGYDWSRSYPQFPRLPHDFNGYTLTNDRSHLIDIYVSFEKGDRVSWEVKFKAKA